MQDSPRCAVTLNYRENKMLRLNLFSLASLFLSLSFPLAANEGNAPETYTLKSAETYNNSEFTYRVEFVKKEKSYSIFRITYPSVFQDGPAEGRSITAFYYKPENCPLKSPLILCSPIFKGEALSEFICSYFAESKLPSVRVVQAYSAERQPPQWWGNLSKMPFPEREILNTLKQSVEDLRRSYDVFASLPEIDKNRISLEGISMGSIISAMAASQDKRFDKVVLVLCGTDFIKIISSSKLTEVLANIVSTLPEERKKFFCDEMRKIDPAYAPGFLKERADNNKLLMINASDDEIIPRQSTLLLAEALGMKDKIRWIPNAGHYSAITEIHSIVKDLAVFFGGTLPEESTLKAAAHNPCAGFLNELAAFSTLNPPEGKCIIADISITAEGKKELGSAKLKFVKGNGNKFFLKAETEGLKSTAFQVGCNSYPWLLSSDGTLFSGTENPEAAQGYSNHIKPIVKMYATMISGACTMFAASPSDTIKGFLSVKMQDNGKIDITGSGLNVQVILKDDLKTPEKILFASQDLRLTLLINEWAVSAQEASAVFNAPPEAKKNVPVDSALLNRMIAASINYSRWIFRK